MYDSDASIGGASELGLDHLPQAALSTLAWLADYIFFFFFFFGGAFFLWGIASGPWQWAHGGGKHVGPAKLFCTAGRPSIESVRSGSWVFPVSESSYPI
jgi:hypothetical protein